MYMYINHLKLQLIMYDNVQYSDSTTIVIVSQHSHLPPVIVLPHIDSTTTH